MGNTDLFRPAAIFFVSQCNRICDACITKIVMHTLQIFSTLMINEGQTLHGSLVPHHVCGMGKIPKEGEEMDMSCELGIQKAYKKKTIP